MTTKKLLIATKNPGKIREIKDILSDIPLELVSLDDIKFEEDIPETGKSFEENAIIKAKTIGEKTGMLTLAEDSGLEVDALDGRPGIYSARYTEGTDLDRINKLLKELKGVPKEKRTARYKAVVAVYIPNVLSSSRRRGSKRILDQLENNNSSNILIFNGSCEGYITEKPVGTNGFGYDPIFKSLDLGKTNGEATPEEKNRVSHRGKAIAQCRDLLVELSKSK